MGGSKWRIETEFETEKGDVGLDEYETRSWAGWHHHIAMCLLGGGTIQPAQFRSQQEFIEYLVSEYCLFEIAGGCLPVRVSSSQLTGRKVL